jgi:hypothetical protein
MLLICTKKRAAGDVATEGWEQIPATPPQFLQAPFYIGSHLRFRNSFARALLSNYIRRYYAAGSLLRVGVTYESVEDCRLVSDDPAVMSWWNV